MSLRLLSIRRRRICLSVLHAEGPCERCMTTAAIQAKIICMRDRHCKPRILHRVQRHEPAQNGLDANDSAEKIVAVLLNPSYPRHSKPSFPSEISPVADERHHQPTPHSIRQLFPAKRIRAAPKNAAHGESINEQGGRDLPDNRANPCQHIPALFRQQFLKLAFAEGESGDSCREAQSASVDHLRRRIGFTDDA